MKKALLLLLAAVMLLLPLAGCKNKKPDPEDETTSPVSYEGDDFGDKKFDGEFTVFSRVETDYEYKGSETGGSVDQAVYKRNASVEERLGVSINLITSVGGWDQRAEFLGKCRAEVVGGGTGGYDLISSHSVYLGTLGTEGLAIDLTTLPAVNMQKLWWNQNLYDALNINGHVYHMIGDIGYTIYEYLQVMYVNETKFESVGNDLNELYELVEDGEWTYTKLFEYAATYGSGVGDDGDGNYGLLTNVHAFRASVMAQDSYVYRRDENGRFYYPDSIPDKLLNIVKQAMVQYKEKDNILFHSAWDDGDEAETPIFNSGRALFYSQVIGKAQKIRDALSDRYGILPLPKYDVLQDHYMSLCRDTVTAVMVPTTTKNQEKTGYCTEAMAMYGYNLIRPAYYETTLKVRQFDDPRYGKILDTIRDGLTYEAIESYTLKDCPNVDDYVVNCLTGNTEPNTVHSWGVERAKKVINEFYTKMENRGLMD